MSSNQGKSLNLDLSFKQASIPRDLRNMAIAILKLYKQLPMNVAQEF